MAAGAVAHLDLVEAVVALGGDRRARDLGERRLGQPLGVRARDAVLDDELRRRARRAPRPGP